MRLSRQTKSKAAFKVLVAFYAWAVGVWDQLAGSHSCMAPVSPQDTSQVHLCHHASF